jgi:hypothetical protein
LIFEGETSAIGNITVRYTRGVAMIRNIKLMFVFLILILINGCEKKENQPVQMQTADNFFIMENSEINEEMLQKELIHDEPSEETKVGITQKLNPFLFRYMQGSPTIRFDTSENMVWQRIWYTNFDEKEVDYGDGESGTENYSIYLFRDGIFFGIENVKIYKGMTSRTKYNDYIHNTDGSLTVNVYLQGTDQFLRQHIFTRKDNMFIANEGTRDGSPVSVLVEEDSEYLFYQNHSDYNRGEPTMRVEFNGEETIIFGPGIAYFYQNGILMKVEWEDGRMRIYTVSTGIGELITNDITGAVIRRENLERRINEAGYLVYEAVRYQDGTGYEYFIGKDTF